MHIFIKTVLKTVLVAVVFIILAMVLMVLFGLITHGGGMARL